ncbi:uncharacterized protein LOC124264670 isoform X2 [Haliotis rubra]|uniref:uncharacterized protein LOC124264670 isoform X2 n=1 Tax=Haliotis rubra TaxID=36100 RepID=UPI001EE5C79B|nr:uncharacterized protein LOC124264670 isoform X2 [Haliotis rubra]
MHVERVFVICLHFFLAVYGVRTLNRCIEDLTKVFTVQLQCPAGEWIHVVHEVYGDGDAATCLLKSAQSCSKLLSSSQSGLVVSCNGKHSCYEAMQVQTINNCNITDAAAEVKYSCIKGSMNMCSPVTTTVNGSVYLHSPGFPDSVGVTSSCVVRITGQILQVALMEQRMRSGMLNISGDGRQIWTNVNVDQYNRVVPGTAAERVIVYYNHDQDGSNVWIRVADSGQMNISISGKTLDASTTPTSTHRPSRSQSASGPSTSDTPTTETTTRVQSTTIVAASFTTVTSTRGRTAYSTGNIATQLTPTSTMVSTAVSTTDTIAASFTTVTSTRGQTTRSTGNIATQLTSTSTMVSTAVSTTDTSNSEDTVTALAVVCGILVLIIVVLVIYFMVVKPFRKKHDTSSNTGTSVEHGETNVYDGIQPNTSEAGDEHNYGHITSSGGPFYANSVSGDDPYVNT